MEFKFYWVRERIYILSSLIIEHFTTFHHFFHILPPLLNQNKLPFPREIPTAFLYFLFHMYLGLKCQRVLWVLNNIVQFSYYCLTKGRLSIFVNVCLFLWLAFLLTFLFILLIQLLKLIWYFSTEPLLLTVL